MEKVLILSDTHGDNTWVELKPQYDVVIHAGDHLNAKDYMIKNTDYFVDGNNDFGNNYFESFQIGVYNFVLVHGDEQRIYNYRNNDWYEIFFKSKQFENADVIIFGHTHMPIIKEVKGKIIINPGSYAKPKGIDRKSYCELKIDKSKISAKIVYY